VPSPKIEAPQNVRRENRSSEGRGSETFAVAYPQWLANVVMVWKKIGKWCMCTDFIDLNKCYPKDNFPIVRIDKIIDSAMCYEMMALLD
jgi:hypothetical protein